MPFRAPFTGGQYSDDTQLARELFCSFRHCRGFDPADYASRIAEMFSSNQMVGSGRTTRAAVECLLNGVPWTEAGKALPRPSNGSAMRAAPIGLFYFNDPDGLCQAAHEQGFSTHADPRCSAGAVAIAGATALAVTMDALEPEPFLEELVPLVARFDEGFAERIDALQHWLQLGPPDAANIIAHCDHAEPKPWETEGISPMVMPSVLWSLYAFLRSPRDYWQTLSTAIAVGGDVDTTAAMAGAISGAHNGSVAIPKKWARQLNDRGSWGYDDLATLACDCHRIASAS